MVSRTVTVCNQLGMHARAAARFVHAASAFQSRVRVGRGARVMDGKSINLKDKYDTEYEPSYKITFKKIG